MEISGVKENLMRDPPPIPVQRQTEKPESKPAREEVKPPPSESPKIDLPKSEEAIKALTENINSFMKNMSYSLQFMLDKENGRVVVRVLDREGKLIRQIPPEAMAAISHRMGDTVGLVVNENLE